MATRSASLPSRRPRLARGWLIGGIVLVVAVTVTVLYLNTRARMASMLAQRPTVPVTRGTLVATVSGSGSIAAEQSLNLAFETTGTVTEVLVKEGDNVAAGQALARLDGRGLKIQVDNARSSLVSAQARLAQAQHGNARPEDLAAAQAQVASAQASLDKLLRGATAEDLAAARAGVQSAQSAYDAALRSAETSSSQLDQAAASLQKAQVSLQQAQAQYDQVKGAPNIGMLPQATQLQQATIDYQQAQANYEALRHTAGSDAQSKVDSAASTLAQARSSLAKLEPATEDVAAARASLDSAKANLAKLTAAATDTDLAIQQAAVAQAEQGVAQAELNLENATLKAPFGGIVTAVNIDPGSLANATTPAVVLINRNPLHVDLKLSENDVAQVQAGQAVSLTVDSLSGWATQGAVSYVAPAADSSNGVVTYAVRVSFKDNDPRVKVGMTADLNIVTARKDNVLLLPNAAILPKGAGRAVQVPVQAAAQGQGGQAARAATVREVDVQTGLTDGSSTEIVSGVSEGQQVIALPGSLSPLSGAGAMFGAR